MKIYFAFGGNLEMAKFIVETLQSFGHEVLTKHLVDEDAPEKEKMLSRFWRYERNKKWLQECDCIVAEATSESFGIGYEIGYALSLNKRVYMFYEKKGEDGISIMATGNSEANVLKFSYANKEHLKQMLVDNFKVAVAAVEGEGIMRHNMAIDNSAKQRWGS